MWKCSNSRSWGDSPGYMKVPSQGHHSTCPGAVQPVCTVTTGQLAMGASLVPGITITSQRRVTVVNFLHPGPDKDPSVTLIEPLGLIGLYNYSIPFLSCQFTNVSSNHCSLNVFTLQKLNPSVEAPLNKLLDLIRDNIESTKKVCNSQNVNFLVQKSTRVPPPF